MLRGSGWGKSTQAYHAPAGHGTRQNDKNDNLQSLLPLAFCLSLCIICLSYLSSFFSFPLASAFLFFLCVSSLQSG